MERGHIFLLLKKIKMPSAKIRGTGFDVPGDREKRLETRKKKMVRKQQVGVIDSTVILALFPMLTVVVLIP